MSQVMQNTRRAQTRSDTGRKRVRLAAVGVFGSCVRARVRACVCVGNTNVDDEEAGSTAAECIVLVRSAASGPAALAESAPRGERTTPAESDAKSRRVAWPTERPPTDKVAHSCGEGESERESESEMHAEMEMERHSVRDGTDRSMAPSVAAAAELKSAECHMLTYRPTRRVRQSCSGRSVHNGAAVLAVTARLTMVSSRGGCGGGAYVHRSTLGAYS